MLRRAAASVNAANASSIGAAVNVGAKKAVFLYPFLSMSGALTVTGCGFLWYYFSSGGERRKYQYRTRPYSEAELKFHQEKVQRWAQGIKEGRYKKEDFLPFEFPAELIGEDEDLVREFQEARKEKEHGASKSDSAHHH